MTRFDEPRRRGTPALTTSASLPTRSLIAGRPMLALVLTLLATIAIGVATAFACTPWLVPPALDRAFVANPVVVYASPSASRADVEALGDHLRQLPIVDRATLRPKEEALAALIQAGLPSATDGRNPLPDAWILALRPAIGERGSFVTTATGLRDTIAAMPGVDQVRFDARWNERLDRWSQLWAGRGKPAVVVASILLALAWAGLWFVAHDAIVRPTTPSDVFSERSLASYVTLLTLVGGVVAGGLLWLVAGFLAEAAGPAFVTGTAATSYVSIVVGVTLGAAVIAWIASRRRSSQ